MSKIAAGLFLLFGAGIFAVAVVHTYTSKPPAKQLPIQTQRVIKPQTSSAEVKQRQIVGPPPAGFKTTYTVFVKIGWIAPNAPGPPMWDGYTITVNWNGGYWEGFSADGELFTVVQHSQDELPPLYISDVSSSRMIFLENYNPWNYKHALCGQSWGKNTCVVWPHQGNGWANDTVPPQYLYQVTIK